MVYVIGALSVAIIVGAGVITTLRTRRNQLRNKTPGINGSLTLAVIAGIVASLVALLIVGLMLFIGLALIIGGPRMPGGVITILGRS